MCIHIYIYIDYVWRKDNNLLQDTCHYDDLNDSGVISPEGELSSMFCSHRYEAVGSMQKLN